MCQAVTSHTFRYKQKNWLSCQYPQILKQILFLWFLLIVFFFFFFLQHYFWQFVTLSFAKLLYCSLLTTCISIGGINEVWLIWLKSATDLNTGHKGLLMEKSLQIWDIKQFSIQSPIPDIFHWLHHFLVLYYVKILSLVLVRCRKLHCSVIELYGFCAPSYRPIASYTWHMSPAVLNLESSFGKWVYRAKENE